MVHLISVVFFITIVGHGFAIKGGELVNITEVPHQVFVKWIPTNQLWCGGCIISPQHILTTVECSGYMNFKNFTIVAGTDDRRYGGDEYAIANVTVHPYHNTIEGKNYDVAIIQLAKEIKLSDKVKIIPLAGPHHKIEVGSELVVSGWGPTEHESKPCKLRQVTISTVDFDKCAESYKGINRSNIFCAGEANKRAGYGDDGGPLIERTSKGNILVGVTKYAESSQHKPSFFMNVSAFNEWIKETVQENGIEIRITDQDSIENSASKKNTFFCLIFCLFLLFDTLLLSLL